MKKEGKVSCFFFFLFFFIFFYLFFFLGGGGGGGYYHGPSDCCPQVRQRCIFDVKKLTIGLDFKILKFPITIQQFFGICVCGFQNKNQKKKKKKKNIHN